MSSHSGYVEQRDDAPSGRSVGIPGLYGMRDGETSVTNPGRRSIGSISKDVIRTVQNTTIFDGVNSKLYGPNGRLAGVNDRIASVNSKISEMCKSTSNNFTVNRRHSDRGIYSAESTRSWGGKVSAEISTLTTKKVMPIFRRQNTCPTEVNGYGRHSDGVGRTGKKEVVSFDYQLMNDTELC